MKNDNMSERLNSVYSLLKDSIQGYHECAENVDDPVLKSKFQFLSRKRRQMIEELRNETSQLGIVVEGSSTLSGAAHRIFVDIKSIFTGGDKDSIIKEIERGEGTLSKAYRDALSTKLPPSLEQLMEKQAEEIKNDLQNVKNIYS